MPETPSTIGTKIGLLANSDWYLSGFRYELAKMAAQHFPEVVLLSPAGEYSNGLSAANIAWQPIDMTRKGLNPIRELYSVMQLVRLYRRQAFSLVHHFTIKGVIYGSLAAKFSGTRHIVNSITGLGHVFVSRSLQMKVLRWFLRPLYRFAVKDSLVIFQNSDDRDFFLERRMIKPEQAIIVEGSGVDIEKFAVEPEPDHPRPVILMAGRLLYEKGVEAFVEAAKRVNQDGPRAKFLLVGAPDPGNPSAVPMRQLRHWVASGHVEWIEWQADMAAMYHSANIVCLPSQREGLPKTLLEAGACGRAVVSTDIPGSREVVKDGKTGILVPLGDIEALTEAFNTLINNPTLRRSMGKAGRARVASRFSSQIVNEQTINLYQKVLRDDARL